jgi:hypothetical protein
MTTEEIVIKRLLAGGFIVFAVLAAAYLTMVASRR